MLRDKYLSAAIPSAEEKEIAERGKAKTTTRLEDIERTISALQDVMAQNQRDNLDSMYNIEKDNLSVTFNQFIDNTANNATTAKDTATSALKEAKDAAALAVTLNNTVAGFMAEVRENYASVSMVASVVDSNGNANAAGIVAAVNGSSSSIQLDARHININGKTLFTNDANGGSTNISGSTLSLTNSSNQQVFSIREISHSEYGVPNTVALDTAKLVFGIDSGSVMKVIFYCDTYLRSGANFYKLQVDRETGALYTVLENPFG